MKAAIYYGPQNIKVENVNDPTYTENDILIRVNICNICGSDIRTYRFGSDSIQSGTVLGHEFVGEVIDAPKWSDFKRGDKITAAQDIPCGTCWYCQHDMIHICENKLEFGKHFMGAFAENMVIPEIAIKNGWVRKLPETIDEKSGSLIEPLSSCIHANNIAPTRPGDIVLVIGAGPIGCMHAELAKNHEAKTVIIADLSEDRLNVARKFNFDYYFCTSKVDLIKVIRDLFPFGIDKVISANPSPEALSQGVELVRKQGTVIAFGGLPKNNYMINVNGNRIHYDEINLIGSYAYSPKENDRALDYILSGKINIDYYISKSFPLKNITDAMQEAINSKEMKIQIKIY